MITSPIAIGAARGAQIVACSITPQGQDGSPFTAAAKIYDPLYYNFKSSWGDFPEDCVEEADNDFIVEHGHTKHLKEVAKPTQARSLQNITDHGLSLSLSF